MKLKLPEIEHLNWFPVEGICSYIDKVSDRPVHVDNYEAKTNSEGPKIILTRAAVENALPSLLGMGLCCQPAIPDRSIPRSNCGVITEAWIDDDKLMIRGGIYGLQFPEVIAELEKNCVQLCPSFHDTLFDHTKLPELASILHTTFTGVSLLHSWATGFDNTNVWLVKRPVVGPKDIEGFENQRKQRAALNVAA